MNNRKDIKKKDRHEMLSRRDFMKYTGTIIFVMGSGCYVHAGKSRGNLTKIDKKRVCMYPYTSKELTHDDVTIIALEICWR